MDIIHQCQLGATIRTVQMEKWVSIQSYSFDANNYFKWIIITKTSRSFLSDMSELLLFILIKNVNPTTNTPSRYVQSNSISAPASYQIRLISKLSISDRFATSYFKRIRQQPVINRKFAFHEGKVKPINDKALQQGISLPIPVTAGCLEMYLSAKKRIYKANRRYLPCVCILNSEHHGKIPCQMISFLPQGIKPQKFSQQFSFNFRQGQVHWFLYDGRISYNDESPSLQDSELRSSFSSLYANCSSARRKQNDIFSMSSAEGICSDQLGIPTRCFLGLFQNSYSHKCEIPEHLRYDYDGVLKKDQLLVDGFLFCCVFSLEGRLRTCGGDDFVDE